MTRAKELLDAAAVETPLGYWWTNGWAIFDNLDQPVAEIEDSSPNARLIVYAVNRLPAYEAAVEALERLVNVLGPASILWTDPVPPDSEWALTDARAALARLRDEVPA